MSSPQPDVLGIARTLTASLDKVGTELEQLNAYGRRSRHIIIGLVVSLALDVALTLVVTVFAVQAHDASRSAQTASATAIQLHKTQVQGCQAGNVLRAGTVAVWERLAMLTRPAAGTTPAQAAANARAVAGFIAYVKSVNKPRNCQEAYRLHKLGACHVCRRGCSGLCAGPDPALDSRHGRERSPGLRPVRLPVPRRPPGVAGGAPALGAPAAVMTRAVVVAGPGSMLHWRDVAAVKVKAATEMEHRRACVAQMRVNGTAPFSWDQPIEGGPPEFSWCCPACGDFGSGKLGSGPGLWRNAGTRLAPTLVAHLACLYCSAHWDLTAGEFTLRQE